MGNVDDRRETGAKPGQYVDNAQPPRYRNTGEARAFRGTTDGVQAAAKRGSMKPPPETSYCRNEYEKLCWDHGNITLSEKEKLRRKPRVVFDPARQTFGNPAKQR